MIIILFDFPSIPLYRLINSVQTAIATAASTTSYTVTYDQVSITSYSTARRMLKKVVNFFRGRRLADFDIDFTIVVVGTDAFDDAEDLADQINSNSFTNSMDSSTGSFFFFFLVYTHPFVNPFFF